MEVSRHHLQLGKSDKIKIIEAWVNNPDIGVDRLGEIYGVKGNAVSKLISRTWFFKRPDENTTVIVKQSAINDSVAKIEDQLELQLTA